MYRLPAGWVVIVAALFVVAAVAAARRSVLIVDLEPRTTNQRVDLNHADAAELQLLPGVGPRLAERIINAKPYSSADDLTRVSGIGPKTSLRVRDYVCVRVGDDGE